MQFTYKADNNQLSFLQLLSSSASQEITYHCKNSIAVFDASKRSFRNALRLMTISDTELNARGNNKFRYRVVEDGCKVSHAKIRAGSLSRIQTRNILFH